MTRVKKTYCMVSLIVAMVVLVLTLSWSAGGTTVYAASMDPDSITTFDGDNSDLPEIPAYHSDILAFPIHSDCNSKPE